MTDNDRLKECVKEFFTYLECQEESDGGVMFNPVTISCCRVMRIKPLNKLLDEMKALSNS